MPDISISLEKQCDYSNYVEVSKGVYDWQCCREGKVYGRSVKKSGERCPKCKGTGMVPTEFGEELLSFVRFYLLNKEY
jgi:hypothetical protein